ncbi:MAG: hypothetical protein KDN05_16000 [Verrucomicrobiae bacterium]|nr:hypothetical protein [Verrucomicrobiae bacterium]
MNYLTSIARAALSRVALLFCTALILSTTVGCGKSSAPWNPFTTEEPDWKVRTEYLESKIDRIHLQMERHRDHSERADFWRITSVLLVLLVFFALVGGAALGSRARRDCLAGDDSSQEEEPLTPSSPKSSR